MNVHIFYKSLCTSKVTINWGSAVCMGNAASLNSFNSSLTDLEDGEGSWKVVPHPSKLSRSACYALSARASLETPTSVKLLPSRCYFSTFSIIRSGNR